MLKLINRETNLLTTRMKRQAEQTDTSELATSIRKSESYANLTLVEMLQFIIELRAKCEHEGKDFYNTLVHELNNNGVNGPIRNMVYETIRVEWPHWWSEGFPESKDEKSVRASEPGTYSVKFDKDNDRYVATHGGWGGLVGEGGSPLEALEELNEAIKMSVQHRRVG